MTTEARERALGVIADALGTPAGIELLVALQYTGVLVPDALAQVRARDDIIGRILSVPPAPEPAYARPRRVPPVVEAPPLMVGRVRHRVGGTRSSLFARWVEGEIDWSPAVMGWDDDDERARG